MDAELTIVKPILSLVRSVTIPAQLALTTSEEYFRGAGVVLMFEDFRSSFVGLEVEATEEKKIEVYQLEEDSPNEVILATLGDKARISTSQFREFLSQEKSSEWFLAYLPNREGTLSVVDTRPRRRGGGCWGVNAYPSREDQYLWEAGRRVLSRA